MYSPYMNMPNMAKPQQTIQYVNGIESAQMYPMQPNSSVLLMDSNIARFYLKQSDASGCCSIKAYDFTEVKDKAQPEYITRSEFEELKNLVEGRIKNESTNEHKWTRLDETI